MLTYTNVATGDATRAFGSVEYLPTGAAATLNATSPLDILQSTIFRLKPAYREAGANWFMNSNTLATLTSVKDTLGRFLVQPNLIVGGLPMLLGFGVVEAQHFPDIGANAYPIALANMKRTYLVVDRIGIRVLQDPFTAKPFIGFYTTKRTGGAIVNSEAMKLIKCAAA